MGKVFYCLILISIFICSSEPQEAEKKYESSNSICDTCACRGSEAQKSDYFTLNCANQDLQYLFSIYPEQFGTNLSGHELVFTMSGNPLRKLQQLPETEAIVLFNCRNCSLTEIASAAFIDVPFIYRVDLAHNELTGDSLMAQAFRGRYNDKDYEPIALADLDLSFNQITYLRANTFEHCPHLARLSLAHNPLKNISESTLIALQSFQYLEVLNLSYAEIDFLPEELFGKSKVLREVFLQGNLLKEVPASLKYAGPSLKQLNLGSNLIRKIRQTDFLALRQLTHLTIDHLTELVDIEDTALRPLQSLELLICKDNPKLTDFNLDDISAQRYLRLVDLSFCGLKHLHLSTVKDPTLNFTQIPRFSHIRVLRLDGNPWHCDCQLYKILYILEHHIREVFYSDNSARCATPYDIVGLILSRFDHVEACETLRRDYRFSTHYEPPAFLRKRYIILTVLSMTAVVIVGTLIGFAIVYVKRRMTKDSLGVSSEVRYTTVRNSYNDRFSLEPVH